MISASFYINITSDTVPEGYESFNLHIYVTHDHGVKCADEDSCSATVHIDDCM